MARKKTDKPDPVVEPAAKPPVIPARTTDEIRSEFDQLAAKAFGRWKIRYRSAGPGKRKPLEAIANAIILEVQDLPEDRQEQVLRRRVAQFEAIRDGVECYPAAEPGPAAPIVIHGEADAPVARGGRRKRTN